MRISDFREILKEMIKVGEATQWNWADGLEEFHKKEIEILCEDIESTCEFIKNECTADELSWISEVWDDVAEKTQSHNFIHALRFAIKKYPAENDRIVTK